MLTGALILRMAANGGDKKSLIIIIAGRVTLSDTGKCFWTSFRCVPAKTQRPETTRCKLNHRLEPSFQTHIHVSSLKNTTSVAQRASQGLLERLCVREGGRRNCISSQRIQRGTRARAIDDDPETDFLEWSTGEKRFQLFSGFSSRIQDAVSSSETTLFLIKMKGMISKPQCCFIKSEQIFWPCMCCGMHLVLQNVR